MIKKQFIKLDILNRIDQSKSIEYCFDEQKGLRESKTSVYGL